MSNVKTLENWRGDLHSYLEVGDIVDEGIKDHFVNVLPPATLNGFMIQMGEPYSHVQGSPTYATLVKEDGNWIYAGNCHRGMREDL